MTENIYETLLNLPSFIANANDCVGRVEAFNRPATPGSDWLMLAHVGLSPTVAVLRR